MRHIFFAIALMLAAQAATAAEDLVKKPNDHCSAASGACRTGIIKK